VTHHALEDLALMRAQPRMATVAPADPDQARCALRKAHALPGPVYFRLGKGPSAVPGLDGRFDLGRLAIVRTGTDLVLIATGAIASETARAADLLATSGVEATVAVCASLAPAPIEDIVTLLDRARVVVTHEAAYVNGGLGSLVSEVVAEHGLAARVTRCAVREMPSGATGSAAWLQERYAISARALADAALRALDRAATHA
jgi:transketolase